MRPRTDSVRSAAVLLLLSLVATAWAADALAQDGETRWRSSRYGRGGAEVWGEAPRFVVPSGKGYSGEHDLSPGFGFGFGLMLGFSHKFAFEGRMVQTSHKTDDGRSWDLDQYFAGFRYTFRHERPLQPYVALGGTRHSMEWNVPEGGISQFERLWGYGAYGTVGVDYVVSSRWAAGFRADYMWMRYARANVGTEENDIEDPLDGSSIGFSLSLHYRIPVSW